MARFSKLIHLINFIFKSMSGKVSAKESVKKQPFKVKIDIQKTTN